MGNLYVLKMGNWISEPDIAKVNTRTDSIEIDEHLRNTIEERIFKVSLKCKLPRLSLREAEFTTSHINLSTRKDITYAQTDLNSTYRQNIIIMQDSHVLSTEDIVNHVSGEAPRDQSILGRVVTGRDGRERVYQTTRWPHCVQGRLITVIGNGENLLGSGTVIGPNLVLTSANNVYSKYRGIEYNKNSMTFYTSMNGFDTPYGGLDVIEIYYPDEYKDNEKEDYALLVLDGRIGDCTGYFGIKQFNRESLEGKPAYLYGYQADQSQYENYLWGMEGPFRIDLYNDRIDHIIDTSDEQAGSALYIEQNSKYYVIGVNIKVTDTSRLTNQAVYLNEARISRIKGWVKDYYRKYGMSKIELSELTYNHSIYEALIYNRFNKDNFIVLKLRSSTITPIQAREIANCEFKNLEILDLSSNELGDEGAAEISIARFNKLLELDLSHNNIGDKGAIAISRSKFINLTKLILSNNEIRDEGAADLSEGNLKLAILCLDRNNICYEIINRLRERFYQVIF